MDGYWINPQGKVFNVGFGRHDSSSCELVHEFFARYYDANKLSFVDFLESQRWIHITGCDVYFSGKITDAQYEALLDLARKVTNERLSENLIAVAFSH